MRLVITKNIHKTIYLFISLSLLFANCQTITNDEKLEDWIFPKTDNFKWLKTKTFENGFEDMDLRTKFFYFKLPDNLFGTFEGTFLDLNQESVQVMLFGLKNNELKLLRVKTGGITGVEPVENSFESNNIFWKMPPKNDTIEWKYIREADTYVKCKSYWFENQENEKNLIIEREIYNTEQMTVRFEKVVEFYKKNIGLCKIELYGKTDENKLMENVLYESGVDPKVKNEKFPLKR